MLGGNLLSSQKTGGKVAWPNPRASHAIHPLIKSIKQVPRLRGGHHAHRRGVRAGRQGAARQGRPPHRCVLCVCVCCGWHVKADRPIGASESGLICMCVCGLWRARQGRPPTGASLRIVDVKMDRTGSGWCRPVVGLIRTYPLHVCHSHTHLPHHFGRSHLYLLTHSTTHTSHTHDRPSLRRRAPGPPAARGHAAGAHLIDQCVVAWLTVGAPVVVVCNSRLFI
jgi:hypothetical protein